METLDIIILLCFIPAVIKGLCKGFVKQASALASIIIGSWIAFHLAGMASAWLGRYIETSQQILHVIAFVLLLAAVILLFQLIAHIVESTLKFIMLGWADKLLGLCFSIITTALLIGLAIIVFETVNNQMNWVGGEILDNSVMYGFLKKSAYVVFPYLKSLLFKQ